MLHVGGPTVYDLFPNAPHLNSSRPSSLVSLPSHDPPFAFAPRRLAHKQSGAVSLLTWTATVMMPNVA